MANNKLLEISPTNIIVQIIPDFLKTSNDQMTTPSLEVGYSVPTRVFMTDQANQEFCGIIEVTTLFTDEKIRRDLLEELYLENDHFDIYVRQNTKDDELNIVRVYEDCSFYRQEFLVPEVGLFAAVRYYFTNSSVPWEIPIEKIEALRPPNQYIYDYAVSKAIKNLQHALEKLLGQQLENGGKILTPKEFLELVNQEVAKIGINH